MKKQISFKAMPRPWKMEDMGDHWDLIAKKSNDWVARIHGGYDADEANANFILRAINNHDTLIEALKEAQHYILTRKGKEFNIKNSDYFHISNVMTQAITNATK